VPEALAAIARAAAAAPAGGWADITGYDQRPLGRHLTRQDLDGVGAGRKLFIVHASGHANLVNSLVTDMLPRDGWLASPGVGPDGDGRPTGLFTEDAMPWSRRCATPTRWRRSPPPWPLPPGSAPLRESRSAPKPGSAAAWVRAARSRRWPSSARRRMAAFRSGRS